MMTSWHENIFCITGHCAGSHNASCVLFPTTSCAKNFNVSTDKSTNLIASARFNVRHALKTMMTSSNGNIFRVTGPLCGEFTGPGEFPAQRPVTQIFDVFFYLRLNKRLSKQPWGWWFETPSWSLWRHGNAPVPSHHPIEWARRTFLSKAWWRIL